ncbi:hypothetical protein [Spirosoma litoris]
MINYSNYTNRYLGLGKQAHWMFALTSLLLWLKLTSGLVDNPTTNRWGGSGERLLSLANYSINTRNEVLQGHVRIRGHSWLMAATDQSTYHYYRDRDDGRLWIARCQHEKWPPGPAFVQPILPYHQLYETHCYQRTGADDPSPLTEL